MPVVVGAVPTAEGRAAVRAAVQEARTRRTTLVVVAAVRRPADEADEHALVSVMDEARATLASDGLQVVEPAPAPGELADELVAAASAHEADCIVIGLRRRSPVGKLILGTNAQRILLEAPCAVLAVKADRSG